MKGICLSLWYGLACHLITCLGKEMGCDGHWLQGPDGHCYLANKKQTDWPTAETYCQRKGGHLTSVHSKLQNIMINIYLQETKIAGGWWIGLRNITGDKWSDGSDVDFTKWAKKPQHNSSGCAAMVVGDNIFNGNWIVAPCEDLRPSMCKKERVKVKYCPYVGFIDISHTTVQPSCASKFKPNLMLYMREHEEYTMSYKDYKLGLLILKAQLNESEWTAFLNRKTVFLVHGFTGHWYDAWVQTIRQEILDIEDMNIIVVDWEKGAKDPLYLGPAANTRVTGSLVGKVADALVEYGLPEDKLWCVGHSLGAQACGFAGKLAYNTFGRVTGLDAAKPEFDNKPLHYRINKLDGKKVDAIHTGGNKDGVPIINDLGTLIPYGDADFYPNGGENQPGCTYSQDVKGCSHDRSHDLFIETIRSSRCVGGSFDGAGCEVTTATMGYSWDGTPGIFYLVTNGSSPFCQGDTGLRFVDPTDKTEQKIANCTTPNLQRSRSTA